VYFHYLNFKLLFIYIYIFIYIWAAAVNMGGMSRPSTSFDCAVFINGWIMAMLSSKNRTLLNVGDDFLSAKSNGEVWDMLKHIWSHVYDQYTEAMLFHNCSKNNISRTYFNRVM
jgi:hypothetical protein